MILLNFVRCEFLNRVKCVSVFNEEYELPRIMLWLISDYLLRCSLSDWQLLLLNEDDYFIIKRLLFISAHCFFIFLPHEPNSNEMKKSQNIYLIAELLHVWQVHQPCHFHSCYYDFQRDSIWYLIQTRYFPNVPVLGDFWQAVLQTSSIHFVSILASTWIGNHAHI